METTMQQLAHAAGYPAVLFGYRPDEQGYWSEPGLPWIFKRLNTQPSPTQYGPVADFNTDVMAPRFAKGTSVAVERVPQGAALPAGVYLWQTPQGAVYVGRLEQPHSSGGDGLLLSLDNSPAGIVCLLEWEHPGFALYRVTHYVSQPVL